jgi:hypothetical protein
MLEIHVSLPYELFAIPILLFSAGFEGGLLPGELLTLPPEW